MAKFTWKNWPPETPLHPVSCEMQLPFGRIYTSRLHGADFIFHNGYSSRRTRTDIEQEMWRKFLRMIGGA
jgi:hypothetical protein